MLKPKTNEQFMRKLMAGDLTPSIHPALIQAFVVDALVKHSGEVSKVDASELDTPLMNGEAWKATAIAIRDALDRQYR